MPTYNTQCQSCLVNSQHRLTFDLYDQVKSGAHSLSCSCGGTVELVFEPSDVSFVLKDGVSGGWVSKATKENAYRSRRNKVMAQRERDHVRPNRLQPNFNGKEAGSWADARDAAYQSTYERVKGEHGSKDAARAATESAKTYNRFVKQEAS